MKRAFAVALLVLSWIFGTTVQALDAPTGRVLLTVSGAISATNAEGIAEFDRDMLEALQWREIESFTAFTEGPQKFAGPTLRSLLDALGVSGGTLLATAVDDYTLEIPVSDADEFSVILALSHNGKSMRVRDKGPIWVVYPATEEQAAQRKFYVSMIWQLVSIEVRP